jgi:hypothetical protein
MDNINHEFTTLGKLVAGALKASVKWFALFNEVLDEDKRTDLVITSARISLNRAKQLDKNGEQNDSARLVFFLDCLNYSKDIFTAIGEKVVDEQFKEVLEYNINYCRDGIKAVAELAAKLPE